MRSLLQLAAALALISLSVGAAVLAWDAHKLLGSTTVAVQHADIVLSQARTVLNQVQQGWQDEAQDVHQIVASARTAAEQAAQFAGEQRAQLQKTSRDSDNQVRAVGLVTRNAETLLYNLDQQLNGKVLPDFDRELSATSMAAQFSFESLTKAGDALTFQINDPSIPQMLESFNKAAASLAGASANASDSLAHVDHTFAYYDKQLTTPLGFWKTLGKTFLSTGSQAGNIYAGFVK
jgi:hypothetical protein